MRTITVGRHKQSLFWQWYTAFSLLDNVVQPVLKNDGIHLISEAMKVFNTNISILQGGCRAMGALAMQEEAREELSSGVGLDLVLSTIKRQDLEGNEVIQMLCCNTLASLIDTKSQSVVHV